MITVLLFTLLQLTRKQEFWKSTFLRISQGLTLRLLVCGEHKGACSEHFICLYHQFIVYILMMVLIVNIMILFVMLQMKLKWIKMEVFLWISNYITKSFPFTVKPYFLLLFFIYCSHLGPIHPTIFLINVILYKSVPTIFLLQCYSSFEIPVYVVICFFAQFDQ